jgi:CheY-like chemotaxis protein
MDLKLLNILLADDDTDDCIFFKIVLDKLPLTTKLSIVHDGEELMKLLTSEKYKLPHVLFLDLNMPRKNGFECLEEIKRNKKLKDLPVILFSTSLEQDVVNQLYDSNAQHFIRKPADFPQFIEIIHKALRLIAHGNITQPSRENFVLSMPKMAII